MTQLGMIGLGRMGANMVRRVVRAGHPCVVYDANTAAVEALAQTNVLGTASLEQFVQSLQRPRAIWLMIPAAFVDAELAHLAPLLDAGDIIIDGGNSNYRDDIRRSIELRARGIHYVDVGTSGGVAGLDRGYCLMIGGERPIVAHLQPIFAALSSGAGAPAGSPDEIASDALTAEQGYLYCGGSGAGHFVKMVHNGIEYGVMAAYAEGLNILHHANAGSREHAKDAETAPLRNPEYYQFEFDLPLITQVWRHGSVISSWLLDLTAKALGDDPKLDGFAGRVSDSGEGRWTLNAAVETGVPLPVISAALFARFESQGEANYANRLLSAMRKQFGGHDEKSPLPLTSPATPVRG